MARLHRHSLFVFASILATTGLESVLRSEAAVAASPPTSPSSIAASSPQSRPTTASIAATRVSPATRAVFDGFKRSETVPMFRVSDHLQREGVVPVVVRFDEAPTPAKLASLARAGVRFARDGKPTLSGAYLAKVTEAGLDTLERDRSVVRVVPDLPRRHPVLPLHESQIETGALAMRQAFLAKNGERLDGRGTVIADIDTAIYQFHPALFRADAGVFAFVDVDGDGQLTIDVDGVDLDNDGTIAPEEVLHRLAATAKSFDGKAIDPSDTFRPDLDFLFTDTNGNGSRDYGKGFDESTPAYGEPLFVFDDADHDGVPKSSERLLRLGSSKIKRVLTDAGEFVRGADPKAKVRKPLIAYEHTSSASGSWAFHATGVAGILGGGVPGVSRLLGFAPAAELLEADITGGQEGNVTAIQWAIDNGANVILTEYAPYTRVSLDGTSEDEKLLDAANAKGILTVSPSGDLEGGKKHQHLTLQPGDNHIGLRSAGNFKDVSMIDVSIHHRNDDRELSLQLKMPGAAAAAALPDDTKGKPEIVDGWSVWALPEVTERGTHERHVVIWSKVDTIPSGDYDLVVSLPPGAPLDVDLFVGDDQNPWSQGLVVANPTRGGTICNPATSDKTITVGAYVLHDDRAYMPYGDKGAVASYSSRGPLLDGTPGVEIAAPDNPMSITAPSPMNRSIAGYMPFGGTSGAGPHVAGAIALLRQAFPSESADQIRRRILDNAKVDGDKNTMGAGKLDIAKAAGLEAVVGAPPVVTLAPTSPAHAGGEVTMHLEVASSGPASDLRARWDFDYDGEPDTEWQSLDDVKIQTPAIGSLNVRVEVRDANGNTNGATSIVDIGPPAPAVDDGCTVGGPLASRRGGAFGLAGVFALAGLVAAIRRRQRAA